MNYQTPVFAFDNDSLTQFASDRTIERSGRIVDDRLVMESDIDRRLVNWSDLPQDGPLLESGHALLDWAFRISRRDLESNFYPGGIYAGENFRHIGSWIRDTSFTSMMGLGTFYPDRLRGIFAELLDDGLGEIQFEQYRGYYEDRYFTMTDQILWLLAVEKLTRVRGDDALLAHGIPYAAKTISRMLTERLDPKTFLIAGGSSLFDGHSGFPDGFTGPLLRSSSTNLLYLRALKILEDTETLSGEVRNQYRDLRRKLGDALNRELWLAERGYYAQLQYGDNYREERLETLGNIVAFANPDIPLDKAGRICDAFTQHPFGLPALTPWYEDRIVYHSEGIWPFMMGLCLWARHERTDRLAPERIKQSGMDLTYITAQLLRTSMLEGTFMELLHGRTGQGRYSPAQVWSASAMLSVVENGLFGMQFEDDRLTFEPELPDFLAGNTVTLRDMNIRGKTVTLSVSPDLTVSVDGEPLPDNTLHFDACGIPVLQRRAEPIDLSSDLHLNADPAPMCWDDAITATDGHITLAATPGEITLFPGEEQIGSYQVSLLATNNGSADKTIALSIAGPGEGLAADCERIDLAVPAGGQAQRDIRVSFDAPPIHFGGGDLRIDGGDRLSLAIPIRRLLTLDCSWRYKPLFKEKSRGYGRDFAHFDYWDMLRVPMRAEFRLGPYQGVLWLAKKLVVPASWAGEDLVFYCEAMSDWDVTYFNGTKIGRTGSDEEPASGQPRKYAIDADVVKPGQVNTIAVQVYCPGRDNGLARGPIFIARPADFDWAKATGQAVLDSNYLPEVDQGSNQAH